MQAKFTSTCPRCMLAVIVGHTIVQHEGRWVHLHCRPLTPKPWTAQDNIDWARMKNEYARLEQEAENRAYEAEMRREAEVMGTCGREECDGEPCDPKLHRE